MKYKNQQIKYFLLPLFLLLLFYAKESIAFVTIRNGNYFISFIDVAHPKVGSREGLEASRVYNSLSQYDGIFGYGWGSSFESFLVVAADGSVVIQEAGGGEKVRFKTKVKKAGLVSQINQIVAAKQEVEKGNPNFDLAAYKKRLQGDIVFRDEEGRTFKISARIPVGTILKGSRNGNKQIVQVTTNGFVQEYSDGKKVYFTKKSKVSDYGTSIRNRRFLDVYKVARIEDPKKSIYLNISYNERGHISRISSGSQFLLFETNSNGKVVKIQNTHGQIATYEYCESRTYDPSHKCSAGDLVKSVDPNGNIYSYKYDTVHNLTEVRTQSTKSPSIDHSEKISYWPPSSPGSGGVSKVVYRTGLEMHYTYWQDSENPRLHFRRTIKTVRKSRPPSISSYEYWNKKRADGSLYKHQTETIISGLKTKTLYNECCGQPLRIEKGKNVTTFSYYPDSNLLKEKSDPREIRRWQYNRKHFGKPSKISITDRVTNKTTSINFTFYKNGNVRHVRTSDGETITIAYDSKGRMNALVDHKKRKITLKYNEFSKPSVVTQVGVGAILLTYDKSGKVTDFKIHEGSSSAAFGIAYTFQDALKIIKFAGIEPI